jgi:hypothetical protein
LAPEVEKHLSITIITTTPTSYINLPSLKIKNSIL